MCLETDKLHLTQLFFKHRVSKSKGIIQYPIKIVDVTLKNSVTPYEFYQYTIKI